LILDISTLQTLPIWVQFPKLYLKYWEMESLRKLGSMLGIPVKTDKTTKEKIAIKYVRLQVEVLIEDHFLNTFTL